MNEKNIEDILAMNYRITTLLGMVTSLLLDCKRGRPKVDHYKFDWFLEALNEVIYHNKPIPPLP